MGAFRLERDGAAIHLPTRKAESLLAYLALHPELHAREKVAALFWGDSPDELARRSLRTALASLRKELGEAAIASDRESVQFNSANHAWVDALEFQQQAAQFLAGDVPDLAAINFDLYRGELLADFYDEWILAERERLRALYLDTLLRMTQHLRTQSEYSRAIEIAHKALTADPANEQAHQHLMFCHWSLGDRSAALKQFDEYKRALRDELGVEPSPDTSALYERIKQAGVTVPSPAAANTNLPIPLTSFVGRDHEITAVKQLLSSTRLLTLTGVGGCGKTRLAIQVARDVLDQFADGAWWVELAAAREDERALQLVVKAVGLVESQQLSPLEALLNHLRTKQTLLVIDNCEHLVRACAELAETILSQCSGVRVLTTSREALSISGEIAWLVPSLSVPAKDNANAPEHPAQSESVRLFVERATAIRSDFALMPGNAQAVANICRRLDGIPLAIELAAARLKALTVEQIESRLDDRFGLLTTGSRTALPRQQTLRATIDWSYELLSSAEQALLRRLSVFSGGSTLAAAEAVCAGGEVEQVQVLDLLTHLADKSLLTVMPRANEARFSMLETVREYAREQLVTANEVDASCERHLGYFLNLAEEIEPQPLLHTGQTKDSRDRLEREHDNLRAALNWAIEHGRNDSALRLSGAMGSFWETQGHWSDGRRWLERVLALSHDVGSSSARRGWYAQALSQTGILAWRRCDYGVARELLERSLVFYREMGNQLNIAAALDYLGAVSYEQGDYASARTIYEESLSLWRQLGYRSGVANSLFTVALVAFNLGDWAAARKLCEESLALNRQLQDKYAMSHPLNLLGNILSVQGDRAAAQKPFEEGLALRRELGNKRGIAATLDDLGNLRAKMGDYDVARTSYEESLRLFRELGNHRGMAGALSGCARIALLTRQPQRAAKLFGAAETLLTSINATLDEPSRSENERAVATLHTQLDQARFKSAWVEGQVMTLEQAIEEAMRV